MQWVILNSLNFGEPMGKITAGGTWAAVSCTWRTECIVMAAHLSLPDHIKILKIDLAPKVSLIIISPKSSSMQGERGVMLNTYISLVQFFLLSSL